MVSMILIDQKLRAINLKNEVESGKTIRLENKYSFRVDFSENNEEAIATIHQAVIQEGSDDFHLEIVISGSFKCHGMKTDDEKKEAHVQAYGIMFAIAKSLILSITAGAGSEPMVLDMDDMQQREVIFEKQK